MSNDDNVIDLNYLKKRWEQVKKHGLMAEVCRRAGYTNATFIEAMAKSTYDDLTIAERKMIDCLIDVVEEQEGQIEKARLSCSA